MRFLSIFTENVCVCVQHGHWPAILFIDFGIDAVLASKQVWKVVFPFLLDSAGYRFVSFIGFFE